MSAERTELSAQHSALSTQYSEALRYLASFVDVERGGVPAGVMALDRTRELLAALGEPQARYPSVLIAGTKGKGSTAAMVERALRAAGYRTGLYTQPHLHTIRERVRIAGELMSPQSFVAAMNRLRVAVAETGGARNADMGQKLDGETQKQADAVAPPTTHDSRLTTAYEVMTALALDTFAREQVDVAVVEVGLGGRLDAANVVSACASAITSISLDHTQILGDTLEAIAAEKADIIKPGRPCVSAPQAPGPMAVIRQMAAARGASLRVAGEDGARWDPARPWDLLTTQGRIPDLRPALQGGFQRINIAVAATLVDALRQSSMVSVSLDALRTGIEHVAWPGRFEIVPGPPTLVLDGAHNVESAQRLREALDEAYGAAPLTFVLGIATDKDVPGIVAALCQGPDPHSPIPNPQPPTPSLFVVATRAAHPRAADPAYIASLARAIGVGAVSAPTVAQAVAVARGRAGADGVVVVTGSLYIVAEARETLGLATLSGEAAFNPWGAR